MNHQGSDRRHSKGWAYSLVLHVGIPVLTVVLLASNIRIDGAAPPVVATVDIVERVAFLKGSHSFTAPPEKIRSLDLMATRFDKAFQVSLKRFVNLEVL